MGMIAKAFAGRAESVKKIGEGSETRACKHCFKNLIPVYQLPVYPLIGLLILTVYINALSAS